MNNQDFDKLISAQKEEIERIKNSNQETNIKEFYLNKYHELYQEILQERIDEINHELDELEQEIQNLNNSVDRINEDIENNQRIQDKINDVEERIHECYCEMEEKRFQTETVIDNLQHDTVKLYQQYQNIVRVWFDQLNNYFDHLIDQKELLDYVDNMSNMMLTDAYNLAVKIKANEHQNYLINQALNDELDVVRQKLDTLFIEKSRYEKSKYEVSVDRSEQLKKDLAVKQEHKKYYKEEIEKAFIHQSNKHLKEVNELLIKFSLTSKDPSEQIEILDSLYEKYKAQLLSLDTLSNQAYQKQKRLNMLYEEKSKLDNLKVKKDQLDKKIQTLQNAYVVISKNIKDMDDHLEDIKKQISSFKHQQFLRFEEQFQEELDEGLKEIKKQQKYIESLHEERTYLLYEANTDKVKDIEQDIHLADIKLNKTIERYDNIQKDYDEFLKQNDNSTIKSLISEGSFFESNLPKLKELTIKLRNKISNLTAESHSMQDDLKDYQTILMQIQELENED